MVLQKDKEERIDGCIRWLFIFGRYNLSDFTEIYGRSSKGCEEKSKWDWYGTL